MATSQLTCCEREDGSKYWHKCNCPQATFTCESEQFDYELLGFSEYVESTPPKKFKNQTLSGTRDAPDGCDFGCSGSSRKETQSGVRYWDEAGSPFSPPSSTAQKEYFRSGTSLGTTSNPNSATRDNLWINGNSVCQARDLTSQTATWYQSSLSFVTCSCPCMTGSLTATLGSEDTEADAQARATGVSGTSCSSRWETRNSEFEWIKRTSGYKIECTSLIVGIEYTVKPTIRRRTAQDDGSGAWEDVTVTPVDFTATSDTETVDDGGNFIELDSIQGWEYEITGVIIEKKA